MFCKELHRQIFRVFRQIIFIEIIKSSFSKFSKAHSLISYQCVSKEETSKDLQAFSLPKTASNNNIFFLVLTQHGQEPRVTPGKTCTSFLPPNTQSHSSALEMILINPTKPYSPINLCQSLQEAQYPRTLIPCGSTAALP